MSRTMSPQNAKSKKLSLNEIDKIRLNVPPGTLPPGLLLVAVMTETGTQVGYIEAKDIPSLHPISDLTRMASIQRIVGSSESVDNRSRQGDIVKIVSKRLTGVDQPNYGPAGPRNVGDAIALSTTLADNFKSLKRNTATMNGSRDAKKLLIEAVEKTSSVLGDYAAYQVTSGGIKKSYKDFCVDYELPFWLFTRLTTKNWVPDSPQESLAFLLFPKNVSKGLSLRVSEWLSPGIKTWLSFYLRRSALLMRAIEEKDLLTGTNALERTTRDEEAFNNFSIPVVPPWTLRENAIARRSANPITNRTGVWAPFYAFVGRLFLTSVGSGPRNITSKTFWQTIASFVVDTRAVESAVSQYASADAVQDAPFEEFIVKGTGPGLLKLICCDLAQSDKRTEPFFKKVSEIKAGKALTPGDPMPDHPIYDTLMSHVTVNTEEDRVHRTVSLVLNEDEKALLEDEHWSLPVAKQKERRFPLGDAPTAHASQLLAAIRPGAKKEEDRHFAGLYHVLTELFSSFNNPRVTNRAVAMTRAAMTRLKKEGLFFSSDSLTGQGGELITAQSDDQLFDDI